MKQKTESKTEILETVTIQPGVKIKFHDDDVTRFEQHMCDGVCIKSFQLKKGMMVTFDVKPKVVK